MLSEREKKDKIDTLVTKWMWDNDDNIGNEIASIVDMPTYKDIKPYKVRGKKGYGIAEVCEMQTYPIVKKHKYIGILFIIITLTMMITGSILNDGNEQIYYQILMAIGIICFPISIIISIFRFAMG